MALPFTARIPVMLTRAAKLIPQTADEALFRILGGKVLILSILGEVTVAIGGVANATKLKHNPAGVGSDVDLCGTLDINADAVGQVYSITGTLGTAMKSTTLWAVAPADNIAYPGMVLGPGDIELDCAGSTVTGKVQWTIVYLPLDPASVVSVVN